LGAEHGEGISRLLEILAAGGLPKRSFFAAMTLQAAASKTAHDMRVIHPDVRANSD
jgi:hypothetical protein